jgi:hypothetical protein
MATVSYARSTPYQIDHEVYTWTPLTTTNADGAPIAYAGAGGRTVQVNGTLGAGGTLIVEGSNDGTNWYQLSDLGGTAISFTAAGLKGIREEPLYVRPRVTAGDGTTSLTAVLAVRRNYRM